MNNLLTVPNKKSAHLKMGIINMPHSVQFTKVKDKRKLQYLTPVAYLKGCMPRFVINNTCENTGKAGLSKLMQHPVLK